MIRLEAGAWQAVLLPEQGACFASLRCDGRDVLAPVPVGAAPVVSQAGAFLMLPWCNRLGDGLLRWNGGEHHFPVNDLRGHNAIHGLGRDRPWALLRRDAASLRLEQRLEEPDQPYRYRAVLDIALTEAGLRLWLAITNTSGAVMPFGTGWHPWFARRPGTRVAFRARHLVRTDARGLPVVTEETAGVSGGEENWLGQDRHYAGWDGALEFDLGETRLLLRGEGRWAGNLQLYAPNAPQVLCLEPVSHATDLPNRAFLTPYGDMDWLPPGGTMEGGVSLTLR